MGSLFSAKTYNISATGQDRTKVVIDDQQEVAYALSIGAKINDFLDDLERRSRILFQGHVCPLNWFIVLTVFIFLFICMHPVH